MKEFLQRELITVGAYHLTMLQIVVVLLILTFTWIATWAIKAVVVKRKNISELELGRRLSVYKLIQYVVWIVAILLSLESAGFHLTVLMAGSAALLVGIGLGLQEVFKDFVSGIILLFDGTIRVSDIIEVEGKVGRVREIRLRASEMETREGIIMIVPNSRFITGNVVNWTHNHKLTRFSVVVGVAYGSDVEKVRDVLIECARQNEDVVKNPEPFVFFSDFADSQLTFTLQFFSRSVFRIEFVKSDIRFAIDKAFRENGISIPFPQRDVHIRTGQKDIG
ncbi:MAG: mechanosensitive ion channel [Flavobacteriales bacterium]|nr:mechanosensitive ion channel [Flavobacteriales bacterium]